ALDEERLLAEPRMAVVLIGVHRSAEDEDGTVRVDRLGRRRPPGETPLVERVASLRGDLSEDPRPRLRPVDDREDAHVLKSRQKERAPRRGPFDFCSNRV